MWVTIVFQGGKSQTWGDRLPWRRWAAWRGHDPGRGGGGLACGEGVHTNTKQVLTTFCEVNYVQIKPCFLKKLLLPGTIVERRWNVWRARRTRTENLFSEKNWKSRKRSNQLLEKPEPPLPQIMVLFPPQPAEPVSAGFNEESMEPIDIVVSDIIIIIKGNLSSLTLLHYISSIIMLLRAGDSWQTFWKTNTCCKDQPSVKCFLSAITLRTVLSFQIFLVISSNICLLYPQIEFLAHPTPKAEQVIIVIIKSLIMFGGDDDSDGDGVLGHLVPPNNVF